MLTPLYEQLFSTSADVTIYEGLKIQTLNSQNFYQYLGGDSQAITNTTISLNEFIPYLKDFEDKISIHVKLDEDITKDNFQTIVSKMYNDKDIMMPNDIPLTVNTLLLEFNNQNRYIEYSLNSVNLKSGKDIYDSFNPLVYPKEITFYSEESSDEVINYQDFMALSPKDFSF